VSLLFMSLLSLLRIEGPSDVAAVLLVLAFAILVIAFLIDDDDLPGPRLYRVPVKS
jgi:hypothetical protein